VEKLGKTSPSGVPKTNSSKGLVTLSRIRKSSYMFEKFLLTASEKASRGYKKFFHIPCIILSTGYTTRIVNDLAQANFHRIASILIYEQSPIVRDATKQYLLDIIAWSLYDA
jgi:hypothetical protein